MSSLNAVLMLLVVIPLFSHCKKPVTKRNIIASVGDQTLSLDEVMHDIPPQIRGNLTSLEFRQYILRWVNNQVLYQEAVNRKLHDGDDLQQALEKLKIELLVDKLIEEALDDEIVVTEREIEQYFEVNKQEFALSEDKAHVYHICVNSRKEANSVRSRLRQGIAFQDIVHTFSGDSLDLEWDLGFFSRTEIIPEIAKVVFTLKPGRYSQPIQSPYGYHVVKLIDKKKKGDVMSLDMVRDEIKMKLQKQKKQRNYQRFLSQVKSNYHITTNFKLLDTVVLDSLLRQGD